MDPRTPIEDTVGTMARLVEQGKVRYIGLSEPTVAVLERAHRVVRDYRGGKRVFAVDARSRGRCTCNMPTSQHRFCALRSLGRGFLTGATGAGLGACSRRAHRAHPRHQALALSQREYRRDGYANKRARPGSVGCRFSTRRRIGGALWAERHAVFAWGPGAVAAGVVFRRIMSTGKTRVASESDPVATIAVLSG